MQITRRGFLGGLVASATMAEAGALAEILNWIRRKPVSFLPPARGWPLPPLNLNGPRLFVSRDGIKFLELPGLVSLVSANMQSRPKYVDVASWGSESPLGSELTDFDQQLCLRGTSELGILPMELFDLCKLRLELPGVGEYESEAHITETTVSSVGGFTMDWQLQGPVTFNPDKCATLRSHHGLHQGWRTETESGGRSRLPRVSERSG